MLSYRHGFHAGNAADVFKHVVLGEVALAFRRKDKPFVFFDTHAGAQIYQFSDDYSRKTRESDGGIKFLLENLPRGGAEIPPAVKTYLDFERNLSEKFDCYGGSSLVVNAFLRECDEIALCELHPAEIEILRENMKDVKKCAASGDYSFGNSAKIHVHFRDGFEALNALTPPKPPLPTRAFALIDPSYETLSDFANVRATVESVLKKCKIAVCVWLPVLPRRETAIGDLIADCRAACENSVLAEMLFPDEAAGGESEFGLRGSRMLILNSPYQIETALRGDFDFLQKAFKSSKFSLR